MQKQLQVLMVEASWVSVYGVTNMIGVSSQKMDVFEHGIYA